MRSPTQRVLTRADLDRYADAALGTGIRAATELSGGSLAAVWRLDLVDGRSVVLKVGPAPETPLLRYEAGMIAAEAEYFRLVGDRAPVPTVLHHDGDAIVTTLLPGSAIAPGTAPEVRRQLGAAVAAIHTVTGGRFGYTGARPNADTWSGAFAAMVEDLLADAVDWKVALPVPADTVRATVRAHHDVLSTVDRPALLHFDLWDGNVLADGDRLTGLVDGERHLYGDPLLDLVSPVLFRRVEEEPENPFAHGYFGGPATFDDSARRRLGLYRLHLYLLMTVEMPSRGMTGPESRGRDDLVRALLTEEVSRLRT
ncbi:aminoglycoside phosphotransferase family protein [Virgisporangium ochraceum]